MKTIQAHKTKKTKQAPVDIVEARIAAIRLGHGSLLRFCVAHGWPRSTAWYAMQGRLSSPLCREIVETIKAELGLENHDSTTR